MEEMNNGELTKERVLFDIERAGKEAIAPQIKGHENDIITARLGVVYKSIEGDNFLYFTGRVVRYPSGFFIDPYYVVEEIKEVSADEYLDFGIDIQKGGGR